MNKPIIQLAISFCFLVALMLQVSTASERTPTSSLALASPTLEIGFPVRQSLIQFFYVPQTNEEPNVEVYLSHREGGRVRTAHLETIGPEGQPAEIKSVFTMDTDGDRERKLFIIAAWPVRLAATGTEGTYYRVYVYRKSVAEGTEGKEFMFARARDIEDKLGSGFDGIREGVVVSFPYKDYPAIRAALAR